MEINTKGLLDPEENYGYKWPIAMKEHKPWDTTCRFWWKFIKKPTEGRAWLRSLLAFCWLFSWLTIRP
jgi:hypothetical protein